MRAMADNILPCASGTHVIAAIVGRTTGGNHAEPRRSRDSLWFSAALCETCLSWIQGRASVPRRLNPANLALSTFAAIPALRPATVTTSYWIVVPITMDASARVRP